MPGGQAEEREDGQVIFRVRDCEHVQVITEIETPPVGIPSDVTVGLAVGFYLKLKLFENTPAYGVYFYCHYNKIPQNFYWGILLYTI